MIIEIDGYFNKALLTGKKCSKRELKEKYKVALSMTTEIQDFPKIFCRLNNFEEIPFDCDIEVDFVIDTDTDYIYKPR